MHKDDVDNANDNGLKGRGKFKPYPVKETPEKPGVNRANVELLNFLKLRLNKLRTEPCIALVSLYIFT